MVEHLKYSPIVPRWVHHPPGAVPVFIMHLLLPSSPFILIPLYHHPPLTPLHHPPLSPLYPSDQSTMVALTMSDVCTDPSFMEMVCTINGTTARIWETDLDTKTFLVVATEGFNTSILLTEFLACSLKVIWACNHTRSIQVAMKCGSGWSGLKGVNITCLSDGTALCLGGTLLGGISCPTSSASSPVSSASPVSSTSSPVSSASSPVSTSTLYQSN